MGIPPKKTYDEQVEEQAQLHRIDRAARRRVDAEERPPAIHPPVQSLTELLAENFGPQKFRIDQVAPKDGRIILTAQYKAGKTTMVGNLIRALVDGDPFLGKFDVIIPASAVVLIDSEMSPRQVQQWLRDQGIINHDKVVDVVCLRGNLGAFNLLDAACRTTWAKRFVALGCDYLILDCLRPCLDALGLSEDKEAGVFLTAFDALLYEANISDAGLVHHMGHTLERSRGDSRLRDWPDSTLTLVREGDEAGSPRYFSALGRDAVVPEGRLAFDPRTRHLTYAAGNRDDVQTEAALLVVLELLAADAVAGGGGLSGNAIDTAVKGDCGRDAARKALKKELAAGFASRIGVKPGPRKAQLHYLLHPCSVCGMPVAAGDETHQNCLP